MASAVVDEILQELLGGDLLPSLQIRLRLMRTFLLFARKWKNNVRSKSNENTSSSSTSSLMMEFFLNWLENTLIVNGKDFHNLCLAHKNEIGSRIWVTRDLFERAAKFEEWIDSFSREIIAFYISLSDYNPLQSRDQLLEFIDALQLNMSDFQYRHSSDGDSISLESLQENLQFFKNFIRFAQLRGFEPWQLQFLFTHLHVVALNAARICHVWMFYSCSVEFQLQFSGLLLKINPVDRQIHEKYIQVLMASKFSGSSHALTPGTDRHVLRDFVDSLLYKILEALTSRDSYMVSLKDQVPMLYEGLIFLRTIFTNHLMIIDVLNEKVKGLIGAVVNEAAIVACSTPLYKMEEGLAKEMNFALLNFLEKIKLIKLIMSAFIFPRSNEHAFLEFFLENLKELPSCKADSIAYAKDQIRRVQEDLESLRLSFPESVLDQRKQNEKFQSLWSRVAKVAHKTRFVIESLVVGDILDCSALVFDLIKEEISLIRMEASRIDDNQHGLEAQNATKTSSPSPSQGDTPTINKMEVTLDDEADMIIGEIIRGPKKRDIISIVGMPGLGKTTLAKSVYDDPSVRDHFHTRAWCVISPVFEKKNLLLQILSSIVPDFSVDDYLKKNQYELEEKLKKCLLGRRYLIVLDDVWDTDAWRGLERSFPDDGNSSRILITSRHSEVAKKINPIREPHRLRLLTDEESWHLLQKKLSCKKCYPLDLGEKIAKNCKGLTLTIVIVAGILANLEQDGWAEIAERLSLSDLPVVDQCMHILEVSCKTLPENLRSCFLYFGTFREDEEITCKRLIWLWNAEGFVQKYETKSVEDVANDYMNDLIGRSLVMVSKERSIGGAKTCRVHDLLYEFCVVKAKKEKFLLSGHDELFNFHGRHDLQRLCIHSSLEDFEKSGLFCPSIRSLKFAGDPPYPFKHRHVSFISHFFKLLKVLDLTNIYLNHTFPSEIALLVELRYLAIHGHVISIPPIIADLSNLETLLVRANEVSLPDTIWDLPKLRVLQSPSHGLFVLNSGLVSTNLHNLDTFSMLQVSLEQLEKITRKLPNIRILKCMLLHDSSKSKRDCRGIAVMDWLSSLESLYLSVSDIYNSGFRFPLNLKKLTLKFACLTMIPKRGELPNLVVLKLFKVYFEGGTWDMNGEWEFPKLKVLMMSSSSIVRWTGSDGVDHFPCLEKLGLHCKKLKEVPSCLGDIQTLQMIGVYSCRKSAVSSFQKIKEEQNNWGNDIQMLIENAEDESSEDEED